MFGIIVAFIFVIYFLLEICDDLVADENVELSIIIVMFTQTHFYVVFLAQLFVVVPEYDRSVIKYHLQSIFSECLNVFVLFLTFTQKVILHISDHRIVHRHFELSFIFTIQHQILGFLLIHETCILEVGNDQYIFEQVIPGFSELVYFGVYFPDLLHVDFVLARNLAAFQTFHDKLGFLNYE